jgi:type VI protein secretion system component VasF
MAWGKKSTNNANPSGGWGGGDDFWGDSGTIPDTPSALPAAAAFQPPPSTPPNVKRPLLEHLQPLFLYVCEQHRLAKDGGNTGAPFATVRQTVLDKVALIDQAARYDPVLRQHLDKLKEPILWYLDFTFASPDSAFAFRNQWNDQRLAKGGLSGDDAFFDELNKELANDAKDEAANERLAFYYTALGLGFTGRYFKRDEDHRRELKSFMQRIYPRVGNYIDTDASGKVTPEAYRFTDKRVFVVPSREKPMIFFVACLLILSSLLFGYLHWFTERTAELQDYVKQVKHVAAPNPK